MFYRSLTPKIQQLAELYPVVTLLGPRQSGKTTLVKSVFPHLPYVNMESAENRALAAADPLSFMEKYKNGAVLDEIQRAPELLSYIQVKIDEEKKNGMFILTGSHQVDLQNAIAQSLAGRTSILRLLPMSLDELKANEIQIDTFEAILKGGYPRIFKENLPLSNAYSSYFQTYVERDVRNIIKIKDVLQFERFVKLLASRIGQIVNYTSLASDVGVSSVTIKEWISVMEASFLIFRLEPYFENFGKRVIKSPKIYFTDTGLTCFILGIESSEQLQKDPLYGNLFENFVILELLKNRYNQALEPRFYFFRDTQGKEVDLVLQSGTFLTPVEIKSSKTFSSSFLDGLHFFESQAKSKVKTGLVIYAGEKTQQLNNYKLFSLSTMNSLFEDLNT